MKSKITAALLLVGSWAFAQSTARVQLIHNAPDPVADSVNVFIGNTPLLTDFAFRAATPFIDAQAGVPLRVSVLPKGVTDTAQAVFQTDVTLMANETYVIVANGVIDTTAFATNRSFGLDVFMGATEQSTAGNSDILVHHGSPDAPGVDVDETAVVNGNLINNLDYGSFSQLTDLLPLDYRLWVQDSTRTVAVGEYLAPLNTLGLADSSLVAFASGFLNPVANPGPAFGLFVALPNGSVLPLPMTTADVQVIHNVGDPAAASVDVWINNVKALSDFDFRTATPYIPLAANADLNLAVTAPNSTSPAGALINATVRLERDSSYVVVASGVSNNPGFSVQEPLELKVNAGRQAARTSGNTEVLVYHGAVDAGTVSVNETTVPVPDLIPSLDYGDFAGYLSLGNLDYDLEIVLQPDSIPAIRFAAPLQTLGLADSALVVVASGFVDSTQGGLSLPGFGLWAALPTGGNLIPLPVSSGLSTEELTSAATLEAYPLPARDYITLRSSAGMSGNVEVSLLNLAGQSVRETRFEAGAGAELQLSVKDLPRGVYLLQSRQADGQVKTLKIQLQ